MIKTEQAIHIRERCQCSAEFEIVADGQESREEWHKWQEEHAYSCIAMTQAIAPRLKVAAEWKAECDARDEAERAKRAEYARQYRERKTRIK